MFETIVALATAPAKSALAIVRLSGDDCFSIVSKVFSKNITNEKTRSIHFGYIYDNNSNIDQVVLLTYIAPHSFTGENSVEIICHGSVLIANQIISVLLKNGARLATNGEFSSRAYLNGKIDLVQAEAINDIINATTIEAKELSMISLEGKSSLLFRPIKDDLAALLSEIEVNIDYPEYTDIEEVNREKLLKVSNEILNKIETLIQDGEKDKIYREGLNVVIVGKPNVGKSSLLNTLLKEDKAIVTDIAGTTRDVVEGTISINGVPIRLFDTAGIHQSTDLIEQIGIDKAKEIIVKSDLVLFLVDNQGFDDKLYDFIKNKKHIIVYTKSDLVKQKTKDNIYVSSINNDIDQLINKIKNVMNIGEVSLRPSFNNTRQLGLLKSISTNLKQAIIDAKNNQPIDLISASLLLAYNSSLDLLGETNKNDLTKEIFSRFCVGK